MREFMDYIQRAFYSATGWNGDNSYSSLNATADALLGFPTPRGLRVTLGSLASPQFATAYQLGTVGVVDGAIAYLYSSVPLLPAHAVAQTDRVPLPDLLRSYQALTELPSSSLSPTGLAARSWDDINPHKRHAMAYGRLYLPRSMLEALVVRRFGPRLQLQVSAVSDKMLRNGGTVLGMLQYDRGRYGLEGLASSDGGLMGVRGLYNFGGDLEKLDAPAPAALHEDNAAAAAAAAYGQGQGQGQGSSGNSNGGGERERIYGRFSTGAELYYGTLNKSGGMSMGVRFATLPAHKGAPLTATMTINPLMGNVSWTYSVMASRLCSLATRMDFNVYSYESDWAVGMELWRKKGAGAVNDGEDVEMSSPSDPSRARRERSFQAKLEWRLDDPPILGSPQVLSSPAETSPTPEPKMVPQSTETSPKPATQLEVPRTLEKETSPAPPKPIAKPPVETILGKDRSFLAKLEWRQDELDHVEPPQDEAGSDDDEYSGVLKARLDQHLKIGLLWEGRVKSLLFSLGSGIDLRRLDAPFRSLGLEIQFSS